eukprot:scaffold21034_cov18-Tisochrysis_lutea.AAC.2
MFQTPCDVPSYAPCEVCMQPKVQLAPSGRCFQLTQRAYQYHTYLARTLLLDILYHSIVDTVGKIQSPEETAYYQEAE